MSKTVTIDGKQYTVPDDATLEEIEAFIAASSPQLHGPELAAQRKAEALQSRVASQDPLRPAGGEVRKPDAFDRRPDPQTNPELYQKTEVSPGVWRMELIDPQAYDVKEPPKSLQQDIADRLGAGADFLMAPLAARNTGGADPTNAIARMAVEPLARLPEALVRDPLKTIAQDYNPIYQAGMGIKDVESAAGRAVQGDFAAAGMQGLQGATQIMGGALGLMGMKGGPKAPGTATSLAQAERMAADTRAAFPAEAVAPAVEPKSAAPMTYEEVADLVRKAARGGMGSQQAVEKLARAAPINKDAAAAAERLGIDVPPDVLLDHTQLKEAIGLTRSMPGTLASAAWSDAVERAATKADEAMAMIDGSPDLSEVSDSVYKSMDATQRALEAQANDMYKLINAKISGAAPKGEGASVSQAPQSRSVADVTLPDGRKYDVTAEVFKDRDAVVMSPSWPSNMTEDLTGAIKHQQSTLKARKAGMDVVNDAPRAPDWAEQNPKEWGDVQRQVGERFLGMVNSTPGPHILALVDGVDQNSLGSMIENALPANKQLIRSPGNGEFAVIDKAPKAQWPEQFQRWDSYYPRYNQKIGNFPPPADWAVSAANDTAPPSPSTVTPIKPPPVKNGAEAAAKPPPTVDLVNKTKAPAGEVDIKNLLGGQMEALYRNPSPRDLQRLAAKQKTEEFRWVRDSDGNVYVGNANTNVHDAMLRGLRGIGVDIPGGNINVHSFVRANPGEPGLGGMIRRNGDQWEIQASGETWQPFTKGGTTAAAKPPPTVDLVNSRRLMDGVVRELGGDTSKLSSLEKELADMASPGRKTPVTYAALMRMKSDVGQALERASGPYKDVNSGILKRLYGALAEDQLLNVERIGGKQLRDDLRLANQLTAKRKALEDRIVSLFGDERDGSIARKLVTAVQGGAKGDVTGFNRIVRQLPPELRKKAVATAIAAASRETKTNGFGFAKYVDLYQGLRRNSEVYKTVVETLGPESDKFLNDLYKISKRITEARANVKTTGQANQALVQGMMAEGLVQQVMGSTFGRMATTGAATTVAGASGGTLAGASTAMLVNALSRTNKKTINAAGDLFASPEWQQLVAQVAAEDRVNPRAFNAARTSKAFREWTKTAGITDPDAWLRNALAVSIGTGIASNASELEAAQ